MLFTLALMAVVSTILVALALPLYVAGYETTGLLCLVAGGIIAVVGKTAVEF